MLALAMAACSPPKPPPKPGDLLAWAYPGGPPTAFPSTAPGPHTVPGSAITLTGAQIDDEHAPPDWFPDEHPPAPASVAHGHAGGPIVCAACHLMNGQGFIGAPNLSGLPAAYIVKQVQAFRNGQRTSWQKPRPDTDEMIKAAQGVTDPELREAAAYFAGLPRRAWVRVVEADKVPVTKPNPLGWQDLVPGGGVEPIAGRIIEVPEDTARTFLSDPHSGLVIYVPAGSIARGAALVKSGGAGGQPCASCHGADLRGAGEVPSLAGRSAAYLARMLWDIKTGARGGPDVAPMAIPTKGLSEANIIDVVAYLASLKP